MVSTSHLVKIKSQSAVRREFFSAYVGVWTFDVWFTAAAVRCREEIDTILQFIWSWIGIPHVISLDASQNFSFLIFYSHLFEHYTVHLANRIVQPQIQSSSVSLDVYCPWEWQSNDILVNAHHLPHSLARPKLNAARGGTKEYNSAQYITYAAAGDTPSDNEARAALVVERCLHCIKCAYLPRGTRIPDVWKELLGWIFLCIELLPPHFYAHSHSRPPDTTHGKVRQKVGFTTFWFRVYGDPAWGETSRSAAATNMGTIFRHICGKQRSAALKEV
jgi:hypothetical protein